MKIGGPNGQRGEPPHPWQRYVAVPVAGLAAALVILLIGVIHPGAPAGQGGGERLLAATDEAHSGPDRENLKTLVIQGKTTQGKTIHDAPRFTVLPRSENLDYFPCSECHEDEEFNPRERKLTEEHEDIILVHGAKRFWCTTCHNIKNDSDTFVSLKGKPIEFDRAYLLCGQCHFQRQKDWYFGGHGKRVGAWPTPLEIPLTYDALRVSERETIGTWRGERKILSCPACHDPHSPSIKPYKPSPPPKVRKGLTRDPPVHEVEHRLWDRLAQPHE